jgi:MYND finger
MSYTKFSSAMCGLTIVAHGEIKVYSGNHIKQCLDAVCTGSESLHVFRKGLTDLTDDPTLVAGATEQFLTSPECRALMSQIPDSVYESGPTVPVGVHRSCRAPFFAPDELFLLNDCSCTVAECWTVRHPTMTGHMFTTIELYTIDDDISDMDDTNDNTPEQFTLVTTLMDPESNPKNPTLTFTFYSDDSELIVNIGRRSDMKMYCYHCAKNVRTKICPCRKRRYCSSECQKADWNEGDHKYDDDHRKLTKTTTSSKMDEVD